MNPEEPTDTSNLRRRADDHLNNRKSEIDSRRSDVENQGLLNELQLQQMAMEMQNEELRRTQEQLERSRSRYADLYDFAPVGYIVLNKKSGIEEVNLTCAAMLGIDRSKLTGMLFLRYVVKDDVRKFEEHVDRCFKNREKVYTEIDLLKKDNVAVSVQLLSIPVQNAQGQVTRCRTAITDITDRKQVEEKLHRIESLNRKILNIVREGFVVINREYRILTANRAYCQKGNLSVEEIQGKHCYAYSHNSDQPCHEAGLECGPKHTFETGEVHKTSHIHKDQQNQPVYVEIYSYPLKDESGTVTAVLEVIDDITERKKLENQLRESQKMEGIGLLAGGMAHDFNNILSAIMGHAYMLQTEMDGADPRMGHLTQIIESSERAANLTRSLLAFSRKQTLNPEQIDLNKAAQKVMGFLHRLIGEDIAFHIKVDAEPLCVMADHTQLEQILMNLATNARDAMPDGGLLSIETTRIEVTGEYVTRLGYGKPGCYALISVSDTGMGMDENTKLKIFEPFFTTKEVGKGTGLGLAVVYGIIQQHNGLIDVYSKPGEGTTFKIYLPLIPACTETSRPVEMITPLGGTETVLLAEDDEVARKLSTLILERQGYQVISAKDGAEAIDKFVATRDRIDLVVLDVIMPEKSAREVHDAIKKFSPEMKMLFTSGYTAEIIRKKGILDEGIHFLSKPVSPTVFLKKVRDVLDQ